MPASQPDILIYPDSRSLLEAAARHIIHHARLAVRQRNVFTFALAGGTTPKGLYALLAEPPFRTQLDWTKAGIFWGDERHVPPEHLESNYRMAREAMLRHLPIPPEHIHRMPGELPDVRQAADRYEDILRAQFNVSAPETPRFDFILLGMGPDGHTASLFPGAPAIHERRRLVAATWAPVVRAPRMTFTPVLLNEARQVTFLVQGSEKARMVQTVLEGPLDPGSFPSQIVHPRQGHLTWFIDREAGSKLAVRARS